MNQKNKKLVKGVTLIEVVVAIFIFTVMIMIMVSVFATLIQRHRIAKIMQQRTEELSIGMSYVTKAMRMSRPTSTCRYVYVSTVVIYRSSCAFNDNVTGTNRTFTFDNTAHTLSEVGKGVILSNVTGTFILKPEVVQIKVVDTNDPSISIQSSVSPRNYR